MLYNKQCKIIYYKLIYKLKFIIWQIGKCLLDWLPYKPFLYMGCYM